MKFRKAAAGVLAAVILAAGIPEADPKFGISIVSEAASKLKAPKVTLVSTVDDTVTIRWKKVSGADGYKLFMYDPARKQYITYGKYTDEVCAVTGLKSGLTYKFMLAAYVKKNGKLVTQTMSAVFKAKTDMLPAPKNIKTSVGESTVTLKWDKVNGADGYNVFRYDASKNLFMLIGSADTEEYTDTGLKVSTEYLYRVAALVNDGKKNVAQTVSEAVAATPKRDAELKITDVTFFDKSGKPHKLSDFAGKPIIVNLWAIWSDWSYLDLKRHQKMYDKYSDEVEFLIICRCKAQDREEILNFLNRHGYTFEPYFDQHNEVNKAYGEDLVPSTFTISKDGELVETVRHSLNEEEIEGLIERAKKA